MPTADEYAGRTPSSRWTIATWDDGRCTVIGTRRGRSHGRTTLSVTTANTHRCQFDAKATNAPRSPRPTTVRWIVSIQNSSSADRTPAPGPYGIATIGGRASDTPPLVAKGPVWSTSVAEPIEMPSASICCATSMPTHSPTG